MFSKMKDLSITRFTSERGNIGDWVCKTNQELVADTWNDMNKKGKKERSVKNELTSLKVTSLKVIHVVTLKFLIVGDYNSIG